MILCVDGEGDAGSSFGGSQSRRVPGIFRLGRVGAPAQSQSRNAFGSSVRELLAWFAPGLGLASPGLPERTARVAAVQCTERRGVWLAAHGDLPQMNHIVIGVQSTKRQLDGTPLPRPSGVFTKCAKKAARREGWLLKDTVTDGNCGPDTMAYYEGLERTPASYCLVRSRIAEFMTAKAACPQ